MSSFTPHYPWSRATFAGVDTPSRRIFTDKNEAQAYATRMGWEVEELCDPNAGNGSGAIVYVARAPITMEAVDADRVNFIRDGKVIGGFGRLRSAAIVAQDDGPATMSIDVPSKDGDE